MKTLLAALFLSGTMVMSSAPVVAAEGVGMLIEVRDRGVRRDRGYERGYRQGKRDRRYRRNRGWNRGWGWGPPPRRRYWRDCDVSLGPFCVNL